MTPTQREIKMIKSFDRQTVRELQQEIEDSLQRIAKRHKININNDGASFTPFNVRMRLSITTPKTFENPVIGQGITADDFGKTFLFNNTEYSIKTIRPNARKNSVLVERTRDGKNYVMSPDIVLMALGKKPNTATKSPVQSSGRLDPNPYPGDWENWNWKKADIMLNKIPADKIIRFPRADGYALYFVKSVNPLVLQHIPYGDAWTIPDAHIRGLRSSEVQSMLDREKALRELFAKKAKAKAKMTKRTAK